MSSIVRNRDSSIDLTPSVLIWTWSLARIASSPAFKHDSVLALLYKAIGRTESGTDDKSPYEYHVERLSV